MDFLMIHYLENFDIAPNSLVCSSQTAARLAQVERPRGSRIYLDNTLEPGLALVSPDLFATLSVTLENPTEHCFAGTGHEYDAV